MKLQLMSVAPYIVYLHNLTVVCATALAGNLELAFCFFTGRCLFELYDFYGAALRLSIKQYQTFF
jgi:hypothetical protein